MDRNSGWNRSRGQALFETAVAMPLFLFVLFGAMWAVKEATMSERVQMGVRYGGVLGQLSNPYDNYSLYRLYTAVQGGNASQPLADRSECETAMTSVATSGRHSFFGFLGVPAPACVSGSLRLAAGTSYGSSMPLTQDVLLQNNFAGFSDAVSTGGFLQNKVFHGSNNTTLNAVQNFFRSPDIGALADCTQIGGQLAKSFSPMDDKTTSATAPTPLPGGNSITSINNSPLIINTGTGGMISCPSSSTPSPPTTPAPSPNSNDCVGCTHSTTPTPSPPPPPTPTPTPTPPPPPTPTPTPTLKPTATPTAAPTPSPAPTPTVSPKASATPAVTATPTKSPSPPPSATPTASPTAPPTASPTPTHTATAPPTASPPPTATPKPTPIPTPVPSPTATSGGNQF